MNQSYTCFDTIPGKFCGDTIDDVKIRLTTTSSTALSGYFTLKVTAENGNPRDSGKTRHHIEILIKFENLNFWMCGCA
jgi:hypothetical protein